MRVIGKNGKPTLRVTGKVLAAALTVALGAACASTSAPAVKDSDDPPVAPIRMAGPDAGSRGSLAGERGQGLAMYIKRVAASHRWGLSVPPRLPPSAPAVKPQLAPPGDGSAGSGTVPVISQVPTDERVVFLTIDDGTEKSGEFISLVSDLRVPVTSFLTHEEVGGSYAYFHKLQRLGNGIHNHSVRHISLRGLSYDRQREMICGQQENLEREFGVRPRLFRPPYGNWDSTTLEAAASCGVEAVVMWSLEAWADRIDWQAADRKLRPGDIILTHFRGPAQWNGTMNDMMRRVLRTVTAQGFAVARLEDYL